MRPTDRNRFHKDAEARFPIKIDAVVYGQRWPYAEMLAWCRENVAAGEWAQHDYRDWKRRLKCGKKAPFSTAVRDDPGKPPTPYAWTLKTTKPDK